MDSRHGLRSRTFFFCLPIRAGAVATSLFGLLIGATLAVGAVLSCVQIFSPHAGKPSGLQKFALIGPAVFQSLYAILSLLGLWAAARASRHIASIYSTWLFMHFVFSTAIELFFLYMIWFAYKITPNCPTAGEHALVAASKPSLNCAVDTVLFFTWEAKQVATGLIVGGIFIELYACIVAARFVSSLDDKDRADKADVEKAVQPQQPTHERSSSTYKAPLPEQQSPHSRTPSTYKAPLPVQQPALSRTTSTYKAPISAPTYAGRSITPAPAPGSAATPAPPYPYPFAYQNQNQNQNQNQALKLNRAPSSTSSLSKDAHAAYLFGAYRAPPTPAPYRSSPSPAPAGQYRSSPPPMPAGQYRSSPSPAGQYRSQTPASQYRSSPSPPPPQMSQQQLRLQQMRLQQQQQQQPYRTPVRPPTRPDQLYGGGGGYA